MLADSRAESCGTGSTHQRLYRDENWDSDKKLLCFLFFLWLTVTFMAQDNCPYSELSKTELDI